MNLIFVLPIQFFALLID